MTLTSSGLTIKTQAEIQDEVEAEIRANEKVWSFQDNSLRFSYWNSYVHAVWNI